MNKFSLLKTLTLLSSFSLLAGCSSTGGETINNVITSNPDTSIPNTSSEPEIDDTTTYRINVSSTLYKIVKNIDITYGSKTFRGDPEVFNNDLALFEFLFVTDAHNEGVCYYSNQTQPQENENTKFLATSGYSNVKEYHVQSSDSEDGNDTTNIVIGSKVYNTNQVDINVAILGTQTTEEWDSNVDVGSSNPNYSALTGEHSDWTNKKNHKGFDVTANRVKAKINAYISNNCTSGKPVSLLITGHSRGAAVANILGAYYEKNTTTAVENHTIKPFTYTFACPYVTDPFTGTYSTIVNIINTDDLVPYVPPVKDFTRYGSSVTVNMTDKANKEAYNKKVGSDYTATNISDWALPTINSIMNHDNGARLELFKKNTEKDAGKDNSKKVSIKASKVTDYYKAGAGKSLVTYDATNGITAVMPAMFYDILNYAMFGNAKNDFSTLINNVENASSVSHVVSLISDYTSLLDIYGLTTTKLVGIYNKVFGLSIADKEDFEALGDSIEKAHVAFTYVALTEIYNEK